MGDGTVSNSQILDTGAAIKLCTALESVAAIIVSEHIAQRAYPKKETVQTQGKQGTQRKKNQWSNENGPSEGSGQGKEQGKGGGGSEQGRQSKQTGPPDLWLIIRNKKSTKLRPFESLGLKIIEEIGIDNECFNYEELTNMLGHFEQELLAEDSRQKAGQKLKTSPLYDKAKQSCHADASTEARADLRAAVVNYLLINQPKLSLNKLAGEAERVRLFTDDICKCLKAIAEFRNRLGHRDDKISMTGFLANVKEADEYFSKQLQHWAEYDEVSKEEQRVGELLGEYEESIQLLSESEDRLIIHSECLMNEEMARQTESVGNTSVQKEASLEYFRAMGPENLHSCDLKRELCLKPVDKVIGCISHNYLENLSELTRLAEVEDRDHSNQKVQCRKRKLSKLYAKKSGIKVTISVQILEVEHCQKDMLNPDDKFKAKKFVSTGPSADDKGMMPRERADAREGFEGQKDNILRTTSVLEGGIYIQAGNMVISYVNFRKTIFKITSSGMVPTEFRKEVELYAINLIPLYPSSVPWQLVHLTAVDITCESFDCSLVVVASVRRYAESRFLNSDRQLCVQENAQRRNAPQMQILVDLTPCNDIRVCRNKVGCLSKVSSAGFYLGSWITSKFCSRDYL